MRNKKSLGFICLSILCLICFTIGFGNLNTAYAMKETVTVQDKAEGTDFNSEHWSGDGIGIAFDFVSSQRNYETTVSTANMMSGSYSVIFSVEKLAGEDDLSIQMILALGAESKTGISLDSSVAYLNTPNDDTLYIGLSGTKLFIFDRASGDGAPNYVDQANGSGVNETGTSYWKHLYNFYTAKHIALGSASFKFEIVSGQLADTLKIYVSNTLNFSSTPDYAVELHKKGIADGYLQFSQPLVNYSNIVGDIENNSQRIANLKVDNSLIQKSDLEIIGNEGFLTFTKVTKAVLLDSNIGSSIITTNAINDFGASNGEEVFSISFTSKRYGSESENYYWGLVLGVDESGDLSTGSEIKFGKMGTFGADVNGGICVYQCTSNKDALPERIMNYTIIGYKGGTVEVIHDDKSGYSGCLGHKDVFYNVDLNGKIAFKLFDDSGVDDGFWEISNLSYSLMGIVDKDLELKIENAESASLVVGDSVKLTTNLDCVLSVVEGEDFATLDGNTLTAIGVGKVVVKATLVKDESVFVLFPIKVTDKVNYNYEYKNEFESVQDINNVKNTSDFYVLNSDSGEIGINNVLYFKNTVGEEPAQVGLIVPFTSNYQDGIVFDITFTVIFENGNKNIRNENYSCGFAFGLDEVGADPLGKGANAILINCVKSEIYKDGQVVSPTYVTQNQLGEQTTYGQDSYGCYADATCPLTVRLVAKSDGTLEYYRGIVYKRFGQKDIGTYVSDLFATYSGFDFNGYVSMFTNNTTLDTYEEDGKIKDDSCEIKFDNLIVKGNYRMDTTMVPDVKDLGIKNVDDLLHTELPISLEYYIYTVPNLNLYHGYTVEVISGNASIDRDNRLVTTGAGVVKVRITSTANPERYKDIDLNIGELKIDSILLDEKLFENLTSDSQAFYMNAKFVGENTYIAEYLKMDYEVIEGPVSIIDGYLYINGAGTAKIRVYSHYLPSVEKIIEFDIKDGDAQYQEYLKWDFTEVALYVILPTLVAIGLLTCCVVLIKKSKKRAKK